MFAGLGIREAYLSVFENSLNDRAGHLICFSLGIGFKTYEHKKEDFNNPNSIGLLVLNLIILIIVVNYMIMASYFHDHRAQIN